MIEACTAHLVAEAGAAARHAGAGSARAGSAALAGGDAPWDRRRDPLSRERHLVLHNLTLLEMTKPPRLDGQARTSDARDAGHSVPHSCCPRHKWERKWDW